MVICLEQGADLHIPADATATHYLLLQRNPDWFYLSMVLPFLSFSAFILQCFDAVGWAAGRASGL